MSTAMMETKRETFPVQSVVSVTDKPVPNGKRTANTPGPAATDGPPDVNPLFGRLLTVALQPPKCRCS